MKITIKVAAEDDDTEGYVHSISVLPVGGAKLAKMLDNVIYYLLTEASRKQGRLKNLVDDEPLSDGMTGIGLSVGPNFRVEKKSSLYRKLELRLTEADKKLLKDMKIGGLE